MERPNQHVRTGNMVFTAIALSAALILCLTLTGCKPAADDPQGQSSSTATNQSPRDSASASNTPPVAAPTNQTTAEPEENATIPSGAPSPPEVSPENRERSTRIYNEGVAYFLGDGVSKDYDLAASLFREAAEQGHPSAQHNLAILFWNGWGVPQNYQKAEEWLKKAAEQGNPEAQFKLASLYASNLLDEPDYEEAARWSRAAAEQGHLEAAVNLAALYVTGQGVETNLTEAFQWYQKAARQGHPSAQANLGAFYASGKGVEKDLDAAVKWLREAAEKANPKAQYNLGRLHAEGDLGSTNLVEAYKWFSLAADRGDRDARRFMADIFPSMNPEQVAEAVRKASAFAVQQFKNQRAAISGDLPFSPSLDLDAPDEESTTESEQPESLE